MDAHNTTVQKISTLVQNFHTTHTPFRIYHGSTNSTRPTNLDPSTLIDTTPLSHIISINTSTQTALVEPNVPMDLLVLACKKENLLPPVVMEFPGITVGGGFVGTAGESSSFKEGMFDRSVLRAEVVLGDGRVVWASRDQNAELFEGLRGSFGTLGVLTLVEVRLVVRRRFVEVTYFPVGGWERAVERIGQEKEREEVDYLDGVLFGKERGVVVSGRLVDSSEKTGVVRRFSRPWDQWFYLHAESLTARATPTVELVPVDDYLFRYDRGAFWTGYYAFRYFYTPFNRLTRFLLDYFMHTRIMYHALHASGHTDRYIIQDLAIPAGNAAKFVEYVDASLGLYPLWLCPLRRDARASMGHAKAYHGEVGGVRGTGGYEGEYINVGVWGPGPEEEGEFKRVNRGLEDKVRELGGLKWLYARVFYSEDEFWEIYDKEQYTALREKYQATSLPTVWDKIGNKKEREDVGGGLRGALRRFMKRWGLLSGLYGVYKALLGGDYLLKKKSE